MSIFRKPSCKPAAHNATEPDPFSDRPYVSKWLIRGDMDDVMDIERRNRGMTAIEFIEFARHPAIISFSIRSGEDGPLAAWAAFRMTRGIIESARMSIHPDYDQARLYSFAGKLASQRASAGRRSKAVWDVHEGNLAAMNGLKAAGYVAEPMTPGSDIVRMVIRV